LTKDSDFLCVVWWKRFWWKRDR